MVDIQERRPDPLLENILQVQGDQLQAQVVGRLLSGQARVADLRTQVHVQPHDLVSRFQQKGRGQGGIHPAGKGRGQG